MGAEQAFYKSPEALQAAIEAYFQECDDNPVIGIVRKKNADPIEVKLERPYTVVDLALSLGFSSRQALYEYEQRNGAKVWAYDIIRRAKGKIEGQRLRMGLLGEVDSHIARLDLSSNFGYSERTTQELILTDDRITDEERALLKDAAKHLAEQRKSLPMPLNEED